MASIEPIGNHSQSDIDVPDLVAVVGMGCRWPGDTESPSELWDFLLDEKSGQTDIPKERFNIDAFYNADGDRPGSCVTKGGFFLKNDPRNFSPAFFGINPKEARSIDPSQRKLLEVVYESFESSGTTLEQLSGSSTGCFVGNFNYDHQLMQYRDAEYPEPYAVTGGGITILSNRVNYVFNLQGPSITLDTACSSSMVAFHLACKSIMSGDCKGAIVAGSNLILTPECQIFSTSLGAVSPTSTCHTFDAAADGYARADGVGAIYLKRLRDAIRDGNPIRAVVKGTAINANGRTGGISHPDSRGQERVIRSAYEDAGLSFDHTGYFECHGTGTPVGDPLEVAAISNVFKDTREEKPLLIGAIKPNLGHSESASAMAGIMKVVLALENGIIPPTIGLQNPNPEIDFVRSRVQVVTEATEWPALPVRRASVNSFGYGGANAHVILDSADSVIPGYRRVAKKPKNRNEIHNGDTNGTNGTEGEHFRSQYLLSFSAHDEETLKKNVAAIKAEGDSWHIDDLAHTIGAHRTKFLHRAYAVCQEGEINSLNSDSIFFHKAAGVMDKELVFAFTGQGAQWPKMGLQLMDQFPSFRGTIRYLDQCLQTLADPPSWTLEDILSQGTSVHKSHISQPICTAIQIALVDLLKVWGVSPTGVVGHSSGEIAASYALSKMTSSQAIKVAYYRGKYVAQVDENGCMLAAGLGSKDAVDFLDRENIQATVACHNSPTSVTLSGDGKSLHEIHDKLTKDNIFSRLINTGGKAYHSPQMKAVGSAYEDSLVSIGLPRFGVDSASDKTNVVKWISTTDLSQTVVDARYWRKNLESPVLFDEAVQELLRTAKVGAVVEIGPHKALHGYFKQIFQDLKSKDASFVPPAYIPTLIRDSNSITDLLHTSGELFIRGYPVDLSVVNSMEIATAMDLSKVTREHGRVIPDLSPYPWSYGKVLYKENRWTKEWKNRKHPRHDLLGSLLPGGSKSIPTWRNIVRQKDLPWLLHHKLSDDVIFPSTGYLAMAVEAVTRLHEQNGGDLLDIEVFEIRDAVLHTALIIPDADDGIETIFHLSPAQVNNSVDSKRWFDFQISSFSVPEDPDSDGVYTQHARGRIGVHLRRSERSYRLKPVLDTPTRSVVSCELWYKKFASLGLHYGESFQGLRELVSLSHTGCMRGKIDLHRIAVSDEMESRYEIHPAALDAAMQMTLIAAYDGKFGSMETAYMPIRFGNIKIFSNANNSQNSVVDGFCRAERMGVRNIHAELRVSLPDGSPLLTVEGLSLVVSDHNLSIDKLDRNPYSRMVWNPDISSISTKCIGEIRPPVKLSDDAVFPRLNRLALMQIAQFRATHGHIFQEGSTQEFLQRNLDWMTRKIQLASQNRLTGISGAKGIIELSVEERSQKIRELSTALNEVSSESRLMCRIYENLPVIYSGEITGIQVALQDNLLADNYNYGQIYLEGNDRLASVVAMIAHGNPSMNILEVGGGTGSVTRPILSKLDGDSIFRRYKQYTFTDITASFLGSAEDQFGHYNDVAFKTFDMESDPASQGYQQDYDLVVAANVIHATTSIKNTLANVRRVVKDGGKVALLELTSSQLSAGLVLGTFSDYWKGNSDVDYPRTDGPFLTKALWQRVLKEAGFSGIDFYLDDYADNPAMTVIVTTALPLTKLTNGVHDHHGHDTVLIYRRRSTPLMEAVMKELKTNAPGIRAIALSQLQTLDHVENAIVIAETEGPLFLDVDESEWNGLKYLFGSATSVLWITAGSLMSGGDARVAMISGIARGLRTESRNLNLVTLDLEQGECSGDSIPATASTIISHWKRTLNGNPNHDKEFRRQGGIDYISRLYPDKKMNEKCGTTLSNAITAVPYQSVSQKPFRIATSSPGTLSGLYFHNDDTFVAELAADEVEIEVKAAGLNIKDLSVATGRYASNTFSDECSGVITKIGSTVSYLKPGDKVICQSFANFGNFIRVKSDFCHPINQDISFEALATIPIAFCTAIYGLIDLGRLEKGETVLIQSATGGVGLAALQIAMHRKAQIFVTVGTTEKEEFVTQNYGIPAERIFNTYDESLTDKLLDATDGKGFDVILSTFRGERMHETWQCIASLGRYIEIGRTEVIDNGRLSLDVFQRNATFSSFDLEKLSEQKPALIGRLLRNVGDLLNSGAIEAIHPITKYHISHVADAMLYLSKGIHIGKIVLSYDNDDTPIQYLHPSQKPVIDPSATYILVGCLGGLGQSISSWMVKKGAKNLVFISRSGISNDKTREFVASLEARGAHVQVVRGDIIDPVNIRKAISVAPSTIKGVIQGALTLNDALFKNLTVDKFHATADTRVQGTLNLHNAFFDYPLDFFLMLSSWTAMFGTATQSNYLASSSFLDAFARQRRSLGLPACSLSLSQILDVGIVSQMPEYQAALLRNGFYGNGEDEFLEFIESSISGDISSPSESSFHLDPLSPGHLLVGIEPKGLMKLSKDYPLNEMVWKDDLRFSILLQATTSLGDQLGAGGPNNGLGREGDKEDDMLGMIKNRVARLMYVPAEDIDIAMPINRYGMDSMIAAELRNWFFSMFGINISLLTLLSQTTTVEYLAAQVK